MLERSIDGITRIPALGPGFDGERHKAALVIAPTRRTRDRHLHAQRHDGGYRGTAGGR